MAVVAEAPGYMQVFSDGTVKRFSPPVVVASLEFNKGYKSKDVVVDPLKPITARIFLPNGDCLERLPVVVYFHGGGFCIGSTTWLGYHEFLGNISAKSRCIVVSIDYRLAPENRLPIAYEDCFSSLIWLSQEIQTEEFLKEADLFRVFLSGDSAGGNIAHHVALEVIQKGSTHNLGMSVKGLLLIHPYFGSEKRTENEENNIAGSDMEMSEMFWRLSLPEGSTRDHSACNFETAKLADIRWDQFPAAVVFVAGLDSLKERGIMYAEFLKNKGVDVKLVEAEGESHVYQLFKPESEETHQHILQMTEFIGNCN
ncbi:hypothetical protein GIB67_037386 [Kingdonia uniflora]|uniref:Alpha/beta hydrolase fold-3 domain-containing protein n=1 Tax=Kingdonia uniflora TaxID=39325 RepID=A0A7J7M8V2_9MAGN|nr:hypothetical protein GIB67_037386 [Kingdonia uniflora]